MVQTSARCALQPLPEPAAFLLVLLPVVPPPSTRDSQKATSSRSFAARVPNFESPRVFAAPVMVDTRSVAASTRNGAVATTALCDVLRSSARLQPRGKDIRQPPCDYRVV